MSTGKAFILLLVALIALVLWTRTILAHDWYEGFCCDDRDCRPARSGEVVERGGGYWVQSSQQHFKYDDTARVRYLAPDGQYHVCQYMTSGGDFGTGTPVLVTRCLYVPPGGS